MSTLSLTNIRHQCSCDGRAHDVDREACCSCSAVLCSTAGGLVSDLMLGTDATCKQYKEDI